jgi:carboxymethylenebutenolidase
MTRHLFPLAARVVVATIATLILQGCERGAQESGADQGAAREHVDAMSREHDEDVATPSPGGEIPASRPVVAETLPYAEVNDQLVYGHFVFPEDMVDPLPAIIVIHEWWGLNDGVRNMADRLAAEGYIVLAIDLYGGNTAGTPAEARQLMLGVVENPSGANENIRGAYDFLNQVAAAPRIGSLGWCFGGGWSLSAAMLFPDELDAAVIYYGQVTDDEDMLRPISAPILGLFAQDDTGIPVASVRSFQEAMRRLRKPIELEIYPGVGHAFANPTGNNYDAETAAKAWERTLSFLGEHL